MEQRNQRNLLLTGASMSGENHNDREDVRVLEILGGATRRPNDPDTQLAKMLPQLMDDSVPLTYEEVLERLIRDAYPH